jgi:crotonobetainyl-CoA:carnitine CoA-transferase CaiB-like acyl-CoA transferase
VTPAGATTALRQRAGLPPEALGWLDLTGAEPVLPSSFAVGTAAQASIAAVAPAAAFLHHRRGGPAQRVDLAMRHAAAEVRSERLFRAASGALGK